MPNAQPLYTQANVLVGQARSFIAPYNATTPPALPADTVELNGVWPTPWVPIGATAKGLDFKFSRKMNDITIEEQQVPVAKLTTDAKFSFETELSEDTFPNMLLAYGGGSITTVAASTGTAGTETLQIANELTLFSFGMEAANEKGFWRRVLVPIVVSVADAQTMFRRADKQRTYSVSFESLVDLSQCVFKQKVAAALP